MSNRVVHFEIGCIDLEKASSFYAALFDWRISAAGPAVNIDTGGKDDVSGHLVALGYEPHKYVTVYVEVDDLAAYLKKSESLGGKTLVPPVMIPGRGSFAWTSDIDGNIIGLWKAEK
jgi:predicted enzyme related to lactoylglutathione lyase